MKIKSIILTIILGIVYPFALLKKVNPQKITFISLESEILSRDFLILHDALVAENNYQIETVLFKYSPTLKGQLNYVRVCVKQLFAIQSSRLILLDFNNFVVSRFKHKKQTKVLQLWHATGAIKKFGNLAPRDYKIKNYDYVIANADFFRETYSKAFNVPKENIMVTGIPNNDKEFDKDLIDFQRDRLLKTYPILAGKKIITYAPTFRGRIGTKISEVPIDWDKLTQSLGEDYLIIYKPHPLISQTAVENNHQILCMREEFISSIFTITDILITDYSAITIDFALFHKPIISYVPDLEDYRQRPGIVLDYENEFPGEITKTEEELIAAIQQNNYDELRQENFLNKTYKYRDGQSQHRVNDLINSIMEN